MENKRLKTKSNVVSFIPNGDYYYNKSLKALDRGENEKAYKYIQRAAELSPDDAHILLQYGVLEMELQNFEYAYELIHTAYSLEPGESEILFMLAEVSGCMGLMHDAQKYAQMYVDQEPDGMYASEALDILDFVNIEPELYEEFDEDDADKMLAQEKARRLMEKGQFEQAIEVLEETIERFPELWNAYNNLALAYFYLGDHEQARTLLYTVLRDNVGNLHALCNLAVFAYYEKNQEELDSLLEVLKKIQPYEWENRHKLGATLALIGEYEEAYKWLRSMSKRGYEGDPGFYFWLAQSAYFSGQEEIAKAAWNSLLELDPSKEGFEPWANLESAGLRNSAENHRDFILRKLSDKEVADRMFGLFLLKRSAHKQEILAHPTLLDVSGYKELEKLSLAYALDHPFNERVKEELYFVRLMEVAEQIVAANDTISIEIAQILSTWFSLSEIAYTKGYTFKNPTALAAAMEYTFYTAVEEAVTKKYVAEKYSTSVATLTKYCDVLYEFVPSDLVE
ncbi:MAG: tetratricopeptide repeat protein [Solibacillus sp.]